jgi:hypothetical protein
MLPVNELLIARRCNKRHRFVYSRLTRLEDTFNEKVKGVI